MKTNILAGKLNQDQFQKILDAYQESGLQISASLPSLIYINEVNSKNKEFEITPDPFNNPENKLVLAPTYNQGKFYLSATVYSDKRDSREKYDSLIRNSF